MTVTKRVISDVSYTITVTYTIIRKVQLTHVTTMLIRIISMYGEGDSNYLIKHLIL